MHATGQTSDTLIVASTQVDKVMRTSIREDIDIDIDIEADRHGDRVMNVMQTHNYNQSTTTDEGYLVSPSTINYVGQSNL